MARYTLKDTTNNLSRSNHMYDQAQMDLMKQELADLINFYGYDKSGADATVKTDFFDIEPNADRETIRSHNEK